MFFFSNVLDQLIRATSLKINSIKFHEGICLDFKRNYLPDNFIMAVSISLKIFYSTTKKCVEYFALDLTLKASLRMNHTTEIRLS